MGTLVDNGGCSCKGEIKNWLTFRQSLYRESSNVLSDYLEKAVAEMSNKEREDGGVATDFTKFSEAQLKKVARALGKSQGVFLLIQELIKHHKNTFGSNMDHAKCGYDNEADLVEVHSQCDLACVIKGNRQFIMFLYDAVDPKGSKLTKANTKMQSLFDDPLVKKVLQDTSLGSGHERLQSRQP